MSSRQSVLQSVCEQFDDPRVRKWSHEQWHAAFVFLFYLDIHDSHDDLIFLVEKPLSLPFDREQEQPLQRHVRLIRKTTQLPASYDNSGSDFNSISWSETVQLNLVLQAEYDITVTSCTREQLAQVAEGLDLPPGAASVAKRVYASQAHATLNLEIAKAHRQPRPTYPDIYFSIDDALEDAFKDVVLSQPDDCFCVVLQAHVDRPPVRSASEDVADNAANTVALSGMGDQMDKSSQATSSKEDIVLFSGYVVHQQIQEYLALTNRQQASGLSRFLNKLFNKNQAGEKKQKIHSVPMNGPGGTGRAEVAVTVHETQANDEVVTCQEELDAMRSANSNTTHTSGVPRLQCSLMSVSVPVHVLSQRILSVYGLDPG